MLKNEIGKDVDMIEAYIQDSLKAIFMTVSEYLLSVPQEEPEYLKQGVADDLDRKVDIGDEEYGTFRESM